MLHESAEHADRRHDVGAAGHPIISRSAAGAEAVANFNAQRTQSHTAAQVVLRFGYPALERIRHWPRPHSPVWLRGALEAERRDGDLRPRSAIDATNRGADIGIGVCGVEGEDWRRSYQRPLD